MRCIGVGENDGSGTLLAAVRAVTPAGLRCEPSTIQLPGGPESVIVKPDTSKAVGIDAVTASRGIRPEEVCAFGDAENDHDMLSWAGFGVVPSNARDGAKERATVSPCRTTRILSKTYGPTTPIRNLERGNTAP